jgi:tetratricopeptide (TPR) repeat protein
VENDLDAERLLQLGILARESAIHFKSLSDYSRINQEPETTQDLQRAIEKFNLAIELQSDLCEAFFERGLAYAMLGELERSLPDFRVSLAKAWRLTFEQILFALSFFQGRERRQLAELVLSTSLEAHTPEFIATLTGEVINSLYQEGEMLGCVERTEALLENQSAREFIYNNVAGVSILSTLSAAYRALGEAGKANYIDLTTGQIILKLRAGQDLH